MKKKKPPLTKNGHTILLTAILSLFALALVFLIAAFVKKWALGIYAYFALSIVDAFFILIPNAGRLKEYHGRKTQMPEEMTHNEGNL